MNDSEFLTALRIQPETFVNCEAHKVMNHHPECDGEICEEYGCIDISSQSGRSESLRRDLLASNALNAILAALALRGWLR